MAPALSQESASLVTRLAGPSTGKAGLAKDQTEINRIIAKASKGSKFYENEKKKDKELTQRIEKILQIRDELLEGIDLQSVEKSADRLIGELEAQRDLTQTIVHVDMDAFYANVELLDNPDLAGKPFGVGHGVLCTASYEARKHGVRSGMPGFIAKKLCPELIFVPLHFSRYMEMSQAVMSVFRRFDPSLFAAGCDEAYLNITAYCEAHKLSAAKCVQEMREAVFEKTKLTASAGIAPTKMLAKICSDKNKPNGQFELSFDPQSIMSFLHDLSIRKVPGVGRVNERLLESIGIKTCGDVFVNRATVFLMDKHFGSQFLFRTYLGITSNVVQPIERAERKSIGSERTFSPLSNTAKILDKLDEIAAELEKDMTSNGWTGRTVTLKYKLDTYQVFTRAKSFDRYITSKEELFATGKELILPEFPLTLRLIGLRVTKLKDIRAPPEPANGIKRFFGPLQDVQPRKKPRTGNVDGAAMITVSPGLLNTVSDETMPNFHEMDESDQVLHQHEPEDDFDIDTSATEDGVGHIPPIGSPGSTVTSDHRSAATPAPRTTMESRISGSKLEGFLSPSRNGSNNEEVHNCPLCAKALRTDNQGLNAHIDFCLSRGAIRQAQAEATGSVKASTLVFKPNSKGKGKANR